MIWPVKSLLLVFLVCHFNLASATERSLVTILPGFDGLLPFRLETGCVFISFMYSLLALLPIIERLRKCISIRAGLSRGHDFFFVRFCSYVSVDESNGAELFYYFFQSEADPRRDPVLLWLTGGDRCSVLSAIFFEIGKQFGFRQ